MKCHAVGIVKGFLPEEVLSVDCFFVVFFFFFLILGEIQQREKGLKSVSALLNHLQGA